LVPTYLGDCRSKRDGEACTFSRAGRCLATDGCPVFKGQAVCKPWDSHPPGFVTEPCQDRRAGERCFYGRVRGRCVKAETEAFLRCRADFLGAPKGPKGPRFAKLTPTTASPSVAQHSTEARTTGAPTGRTEPMLTTEGPAVATQRAPTAAPRTTPAPADGRGDAASLCPGSPMQLCRMLCSPMSCPAGQCLMRTGSCCDRHCTLPAEAHSTTDAPRRGTTRPPQTMLPAARAGAPTTAEPAAAALLDGPRDAASLCPGSRMQLCRMLCPPMSCPAGQCLMRIGTCCDRRCSTEPFEMASATDVATMEFSEGKKNVFV